jgi:hypothetical protein
MVEERSDPASVIAKDYGLTEWVPKFSISDLRHCEDA